MQKWEYLEVLILYGQVNDIRIVPSKGKALFSDKDSIDMTDVIKYLDTLGAERWEMVNAQNRDAGIFLHTTYYFKRLIE